MINQAARALLPSVREEFLTAVERRLGDSPSDHAVQAAIDAQLALNRIPSFAK
jgi:hypothetical protein